MRGLHRNRTIPALAVLAAATAVLTACRSADATGPASPAATLTVFAAASLRETFTALGQAFEDSRPGVDVAFSFAGSSDLVTQMLDGAPADVFASADRTTMDRATHGDLVQGEPVAFAGNTLTIVVPPDNPGQVTSFADLASPALAVVVCAPEVPCGGATERLEAAAQVTLAPVSEESSVTDVLNKVVAGEADAGLVYVTDAIGAGDGVHTVPVPEAAGVRNTYPVAVLADAQRPDLAQDFVDLLLGPLGQHVLADAGFAAAP
jgi:molybdate transport system substrate-binding protein